MFVIHYSPAIDPEWKSFDHNDLIFLTWNTLGFFDDVSTAINTIKSKNFAVMKTIDDFTFLLQNKHNVKHFIKIYDVSLMEYVTIKSPWEIGLCS